MAWSVERGGGGVWSELSGAPPDLYLQAQYPPIVSTYTNEIFEIVMLLQLLGVCIEHDCKTCLALLHASLVATNGEGKVSTPR